MRSTWFGRMVATAALALLVPSSALALQPLATFLAGTKENNPDARVADATIHQREAEVDLARARLLPSFAARGVLTHNQYEAVAQLPGASAPLVIIPQNQLDAFLVLDVPIADLSQFSRYDTQKIQLALSRATQGLTHRQLSERVVRSYYLVIATSALRQATDKSLALSEQNLGLVKDRVAAGVAPPLDLERATANLERARQDVADAELARVLATRSLATLTRITPEPPTAFPEDDLHEETALAIWLGQGKESLPEYKIAENEAKLADATRRTTNLAYLPALSAQAQERFTNATGFTGRVSSYTLSATLSFRFDLGLLAQQDVAKAQAAATAARADGTKRNVEDAIVEAWHRTGTGIAKARAARAQVKAADSAARIAQDRYSSGASTQLDVTQAQRDAFAANVARIQAELDVTQARAILRIAAGKSSELMQK